MTDLDFLARDVRDHAKTLSEIIQRLGRIENERATEAAVATERRGNLDDRLDRIEQSIAQILGLGKWVLGTVGTLLLTAVVGLVFKGGLLG